MSATDVIVVAPTPDLARRVESLLDTAGELDRSEVVAVADLDELEDWVGTRSVVVAGPACGGHDGLRRLSQLRDRHPAVRLVLALGQETDAPLADLIAPAPDALVSPTDTQALSAALTRALDRSQRLGRLVSPNGHAPEASGPELGTVFTVCSPTGGCGKTFFSSNLAHLLTTTRAGSVAVVDLDLQFGEMATALRIDGEHSIVDVLGLSDEELDETLPQVLTDHPSGMRALRAPSDPAAADRVEPRDVERIVAALRRQFDYVVVDTPTGLTEPVLATLEHCQHLFVMAALDLSSIRNLRLFVETLERLDIPQDDMSLILNKDEPGLGVDADEIEGFFDGGFRARLPQSRQVSRSMNVGQPVVASAPGAQVSRVLADTVKDFLPPVSRGYVEERLEELRHGSVFRRLLDRFGRDDDGEPVPAREESGGHTT